MNLIILFRYFTYKIKSFIFNKKAQVPKTPVFKKRKTSNESVSSDVSQTPVSHASDKLPNAPHVNNRIRMERINKQTGKLVLFFLVVMYFPSCSKKKSLQTGLLYRTDVKFIVCKPGIGIIPTSLLKEERSKIKKEIRLLGRYRQNCERKKTIIRLMP